MKRCVATPPYGGSPASISLDIARPTIARCARARARFARACSRSRTGRGCFIHTRARAHNARRDLKYSDARFVTVDARPWPSYLYSGLSRCHAIHMRWYAARAFRAGKTFLASRQAADFGEIPISPSQESPGQIAQLGPVSYFHTCLLLTREKKRRFA